MLCVIKITFQRVSCKLRACGLLSTINTQRIKSPLAMVVYESMLYWTMPHLEPTHIYTNTIWERYSLMTRLEMHLGCQIHYYWFLHIVWLMLCAVKISYQRLPSKLHVCCHPSTPIYTGWFISPVERPGIFIIYCLIIADSLYRWPRNYFLPYFGCYIVKLLSFNKIALPVMLLIPDRDEGGETD